MPHRKIGEILVADGQMTPAQVAEVLAIQAREAKTKKPARRFGEISLERRFINTTRLRWALETQVEESGKPKRMLVAGLKLVIAAAVMWGGYKGATTMLAKAQPAGVGNVAPGFTLASAQNRGRVSLADYKGKVVLVNFWATWCPPCRDEIPELQALQQTWAKRGVQVVGVTVSYDDVGLDGLKRMATDGSMTYPVVIGTDEVARAYGGIRAVPTSFLVDRQGKIAWKWEGGLVRELVEPELQKLI